MTLAKAKAKTNETFIVQASLTIIPYDHKNMFIVQATGVNVMKLFMTVTNVRNMLACLFLSGFYNLVYCLRVRQGA
jgi:hypothetical protein